MVSAASSTPLYLQIKNQLKKDIDAGKYREGSKLPSEREMCEEYKVSRIPVRKALELLEAEGLVYSVQGKGSFVKSPLINDSLFHVSSFSETLAQKGYSSHTTIISFDEHAHNRSYDVILDSMESGTSQFKLLGYANASPVVFYDSIIKRPFSLRFYEEAKRMEEAGQAFSTFDLYSVTGVSIGKINQRILAINADETISRYLDVPEGTAILVLESIIMNSKMMPIEYKMAYYRTDKYSFNLHRTL